MIRRISNNPLVKINRSVNTNSLNVTKRVTRRVRQTIGRMHLDPWLIDAMRHLVEKKRWGRQRRKMADVGMVKTGLSGLAGRQ